MPTATISWDFGEPTAGTTNTAVGLSIQHQYARAGTYQVQMRVTSASGQVYTYAQPVVILARLATRLQASAGACEGDAVTLSVEPPPPAGTVYTWQDGTSTFSPTRVVQTSGVY